MSEQTYFYDIIAVHYDSSPEEREQTLLQYPPPDLPEKEEYFNLQHEVPGNSVRIRVLLNDYHVQLTRTNKQFLKIRFSNNAGTIPAKMWDNDGAVDQHLPLLEQFAVFDIQATVDEFRGHKSLTVHQLAPCEETINPFSLLPYTQENIEDLTVELLSYLKGLNTPFKEICTAAMNRFWDQFRIRPAAMSFHHHYLGGLLKHTVGLMRFARYILKQEDNHYQAIIKLIQVVEKAYKKELWEQFQMEGSPGTPVWKDTVDHLYNMLQNAMHYHDSTPNYDSIMTSILFHDIGKLMEYDHAGKTFAGSAFLFPTADHTALENRKQAGITIDALGGMIGHIPYGVLMLTRIIETESIEIPVETIHQMSHCILCHHGLPEWGSCVRTPQSIEGYLIHIIDYLDSRYENTINKM